MHVAVLLALACAVGCAPRRDGSTVSDRCGENSGPCIDSASVSALNLDVDTTVSVSARVLEAEELSVVVEDPATGFVYGAMTRTGGASLLAARLSVADLNSLDALDFGAWSGAQRLIRIVIVDGQRRLDDVALVVHAGCNLAQPACDGSCGLNRCGDECSDFATEESCGACGISCSADEICSGLFAFACEPIAPIESIDDDATLESCEWARDGACDEPTLCAPDTDSADCAVEEPAPTDCPWTDDGECDDASGTGLCADGADTVDCG